MERDRKGEKDKREKAGKRKIRKEKDKKGERWKEIDKKRKIKGEKMERDR